MFKMFQLFSGPVGSASLEAKGWGVIPLQNPLAFDTSRIG